jgi:transcriptional regulator with XRE-family HTH domain
VIPTPQEGLASLGAFIRASRISRGINQSRAAREAKVSRQQLVILEKGGNVSVEFLLKVARYLGLANIPLDGNVQLVSEEVGLNFMELVEACDLLSLLVDRARGLVLDAVLPPSERRQLKDTPAFREFISRHRAEADGTEHLASAIEQLSRGLTPDSQPRDEPGVEAPRARRSRKREA